MSKEGNLKVSILTEKLCLKDFVSVVRNFGSIYHLQFMMLYAREFIILSVSVYSCILVMEASVFVKYQ